jgi:hypothetical protein
MDLDTITRAQVVRQAEAYPMNRRFTGHLRAMRFMSSPACSVGFEEHYGLEAIEDLQERLLGALRVTYRVTRRGRW